MPKRASADKSLHVERDHLRPNEAKGSNDSVHTLDRDEDFLGHASIANSVRYTKRAPGRLAAVRVR